MVTAQFEKFNSNFKQLEVVFQEVTGKPFRPGQKLSAVAKKEGQVKKDLATQFKGSFVSVWSFPPC